MSSSENLARAIICFNYLLLHQTKVYIPRQNQGDVNMHSSRVTYF